MFSPIICTGPMSEMNDVHDRLQQLRVTALARLAAAPDATAVDQLRTALLGRSGELTVLLRDLGAVPGAERPALGQLAN